MNIKTKLTLNIIWWCIAFILSNIINLLAYLLGPLIAFLSLYDKKKLVPKVFSWFMTHDNPIDGDEGHRRRWYRSNTKLDVFLRRTAWLWRNKGYTFDYKYLGKNIGNTLTNYGNPEVSDSPLTEGYLFQYDENGTWEFYLVHPYPFGNKKCLRLRFGWKIADGEVGTGARMMIATSIGIYKSYTLD